MADLSVENLQLILVFVVPGFVAMKVFGLLVAQDKPTAASSLLEAITYSMINLGVMSWLVLLLQQNVRYSRHPLLFILGTLLVLVVSPVMLAVAVYRLRTSPFLRRWILSPAPSGWDHFFHKRQACFVLFHLKTGKMLGGFFGTGSFASAYPANPDIYVEQVWRVDEYGRFMEKVEGTAGGFIPMSEVHRVEFLEAKERS